MSELNEILQKLKKLDSIEANIKDLQNDMKTVKQEVSILKDDMKTVKQDIRILQDDMKSVKNYMHIESTIQENKYTEFLEKDYFRNCNALYVHKVPWKMVYDKNNNVKTDIDGCLIVDYTPKKIPNSELQSKAKLLATNFDIPKTNTTIINNGKPSKYIIIEAKHYCDKSHVDAKLEHMMIIQDIIKKALIENMSTLKPGNYKDMLNSINFKQFPQKYYLYMTGYISPLVKEYIKCINQGLFTEEKYQDFQYQYVLNHRDFINLCKDITKDLNGPKDSRKYFNLKRNFIKHIIDYNSLDNFVKILPVSEASVQKVRFLLSKSFTNMNLYFEKFKDSIGYVDDMYEIYGEASSQ